MRLIEALIEFPEVRIFRVSDSHKGDPANWDVEALDLPVLPESNAFFVIKGKNILPGGAIRDCYIDLSLPERINDCAYFFDGKSIQRVYSHECEGDVISAVPVDCFGVYELFYSKINPEVGINTLKTGLAISAQKKYIAEDLGYILMDEGRFQEAAEMFQIAVDETPSTYYIYGELAACYKEIGEVTKAEEYQRMFDQEDRIYRA